MVFLKKIYFSLIIFLPTVIFASSINFISPIDFGESGSSVFNLQKVLNSDPDTVVSVSGLGSPGNETQYFGEKTKQAVIRFQEKYKSEILAPVNLSKGTGYVGLMTIKKLNTILSSNNLPGKNLLKVVEDKPKTPISNQKIPTKDNQTENIVTPTENDPNYVYIPVSGTKEKAKVSLKWYPEKGESNPNMENIEGFLSSIDKVGGEQGYSKEDIDKAKNAVLSEVATTTNLKVLFVKQNQNNMIDAGTNNIKTDEFLRGTSQNIFKKLVADISDLILPKAEAVSGLPFGGRVFGSVLCTCSGNWLVFMQPMPPSYTVLLTHYSGMQMYRNFNMPFTLNVLGKYMPGGAPCMMYAGLFCVTIPSQGMTTPMMGSS